MKIRVTNKNGQSTTGDTQILYNGSESIEYFIDNQWIKEEDIKNLVLQEKVILNSGEPDKYEFDIKSQLLTQLSTKKEVELTKIQKKLLALLVRKRGQVVSFQEIHDEVWKGKNMTRFTLRNQVKIIRDKTFKSIIKNHSNIGYTIDN